MNFSYNCIYTILGDNSSYSGVIAVCIIIHAGSYEVRVGSSTDIFSII